MSNKHTPGPWRIMHGVKSDQVGVVSSKMHNEFFVAPPVCLISPIEKYDYTDEANARLIAAAPEMYEILRKVMIDKISYCEIQDLLNRIDQ